MCLEARNQPGRSRNRKRPRRKLSYFASPTLLFNENVRVQKEQVRYSRVVATCGFLHRQKRKESKEQGIVEEANLIKRKIAVVGKQKYGSRNTIYLRPPTPHPATTKKSHKTDIFIDGLNQCERYLRINGLSRARDVTFVTRPSGVGDDLI